MTVDPDGFRKPRLTGLASDVEDVTGAGLALEINEVKDAFGVNGGLRLNAIVRRAQEMDLGGGLSGARNRGNKEHNDKGTKRTAGKKSGSSHIGHGDLMSMYGKFLRSSPTIFLNQPGVACVV
jgi:hypothetical protein